MHIKKTEASKANIINSDAQFSSSGSTLFANSAFFTLDALNIITINGDAITVFLHNYYCFYYLSMNMLEVTEMGLLEFFWKIHNFTHSAL